MRNRVLSQDKDIQGKLGKATVKNAVSKFKEQQLGLKDSDNSPLIGFELNGGDGMTASGQEIWGDFSHWCDDRNLDCEYNTRADLDKMKTNLRNRVDNRNKNSEWK